MTPEAWIMLLILIGMFILLIWDRIPAWAVFMLTLTVTMTLGLAPEADLLKGFANTSVMTVGTLFVVAAGMYSTGAITFIANRFIGLPETLRSALNRILPPVAVGSAFLNNTPLVAMMAPVVRDIGSAAKLAGSKLLIPLSFASILGGAMTLIGTSTNLIIAGLVEEQTGESLNIFFPTPIGLPAAIVGILFITFIGVRLLPDTRKEEDAAAVKRIYRAEFEVEVSDITGEQETLTDRFNAGQTQVRQTLLGRRLAGRTVDEAGFSSPDGYRLVEICRDGELISIEPELVLTAGDMLTFEAAADAMPGLWATMGLTPHVFSEEMDDDERHDNHLVEAVVSERAEAVGRRISELPLPDSPYEMMLVGLSRYGRAPLKPLEDIQVEAGDAIILEVEDSFFFENRLEKDFILTKPLRGYSVQHVERAMAATVITAAMVLLAAFGVMSMLNAALLAAVAMLLTGCLPLQRAWKSIDWATLVVLAAAIGLESAVTGTGLSQVIADILSQIGGGSPTTALAVVFNGCIIMTNVITNAAAVAFMFPVAISMAAQLDVSYAPFIAIMMLGTSYAFINPAGYQTNLMVQGPGGYTFIDFVKVGLPLTIVAGVTALLLAPIYYGF